MYAILAGSNFWIVVFLELVCEVVMPDGLPCASSSNVNRNWSNFWAHLEAVGCSLADCNFSRSTGWPHTRAFAYKGRYGSWYWTSKDNINIKHTSSPGIGASLLMVGFVWLVEGCCCFGVVLKEVSDASNDGVTDLLLSSVISRAWAFTLPVSSRCFLDKIAKLWDIYSPLYKPPTSQLSPEWTAVKRRLYIYLIWISI